MGSQEVLEKNPLLWAREICGHRAPTQEEEERITLIKDAAVVMIAAIVGSCPTCADRSAAIRHVRDGMSVAVTSIMLKGKI